MNVELLNRIKQTITDEPRRIWMSVFIRKKLQVGHMMSGIWENKPDRVTKNRIPPCGTVACIAGHACILEGRENALNTELVARELIKINWPEGNKLFYVTSWPVHLRKRYFKARTAKQRAKIVCDRIDHFIKTNGLE